MNRSLLCCCVTEAVFLTKNARAKGQSIRLGCNAAIEWKNTTISSGIAFL